MTETQILDLTTSLNNGDKIKATRKQLAEAIKYWGLRCAYEMKARVAAEDALDRAIKPAGLVLPNGFAARN